MKKFITILLFLLTACTATHTCPGGRCQGIPMTESTPTSIGTNIPITAIPPIGFTRIIETLTPASTPLPQASPTPATLEPVTARVSSIDGMPQVYIPAGTFRMGGMDVRRAPNELPDHDVTLDAFWMDQLEVTNAMYGLCVKAGACTLPQSLKSQRRFSYFDNPEFKDYPVIYVTWGQAKAYCEWAGRRLPTEAQWERAARGDDFHTFPWGEDKADGLHANFNMLIGDTSRVGTYPLGASPFGVLDMAGNVAEWVNDFYSSNYGNAVTLNPMGPPAGLTLYHVVRGGSLGDAEINIRLSKRSSVLGSDLKAPVGSQAYLGQFSPRVGFRCAENE